jgi:hypothetical protein
MTAGPFDSEREVLDALGRQPHPRDRESELALLDACARAGVQLGEYDRLVLAWLSSHEVRTTCAVIADIILRAADHS